MIEVKGINKNFDAIKAIDNITATIEEGHVFGLIGTNGAGKSTFMRMLCGVLKPDSGEVLIDGEPVYDNPAVKEKIFYISDDQYFFKTGTPKDMLKFYQTYYVGFNSEKFKALMKAFDLDINRKINTFSKGMKNFRIPAFLASIAIGRIPFTERIFPSSEISPMKAELSRFSFICPVATSNDTTIGRS